MILLFHDSYTFSDRAQVRSEEAPEKEKQKLENKKDDQWSITGEVRNLDALEVKVDPGAIHTSEDPDDQGHPAFWLSYLLSVV